MSKSDRKAVKKQRQILEAVLKCIDRLRLGKTPWAGVVLDDLMISVKLK